MNIKLVGMKFMLYVLIFKMKFVTHGMSLGIGRRLGRLLFNKMKERAKVATDNLKLVYGDKMSEEERQSVARKNFEHLGAALFEILYVVSSPQRLDKILELEGEAHLEEALSKDKGAIVYSGHFGNFFLMGAMLGRRFGVKFLYRKPSDDNVTALYQLALKRLGLQVIADNPRHLCAFHSYSQLKKKGILGILIDQVETGGLYVDFMGHPAGSTLGAANMSIKMGSPLVPVFGYRQDDNKLKVTIEQEFEIDRQLEQKQLLETIVAGTNKDVGKWVYKYPEQWFWGHRRWRAWRK